MRFNLTSRLSSRKTAALAASTSFILLLSYMQMDSRITDASKMQENELKSIHARDNYISELESCDVLNPECVKLTSPTSEINSNSSDSDNHAIQTKDSKREIMQSELADEMWSGNGVSESMRYIESMRRLETDNLKDISNFITKGIINILMGCVYKDSFAHQYDSYEDLRESGGSKVNQELCLSQLGQLNKRVRGQLTAERRFKTYDHRIHFLMDTFGRPSSGLYEGKIFWEGDFDNCLRHQIQLGSQDEEKAGFRYCVAHLKHPEWKAGGKIDKLISFKSAACLPKACDSQNYKNKYDLVLDLIESQTYDMTQGQLELTSLYCLPDEESPLRAWWRAPATLMGAALALCWLSFLVYCTIKDKSIDEEERSKHPYANLYKSLSITQSWMALFACSINKNQPDGNPKTKPILDFRFLEGVKVLSMCNIICGHIMMLLTGVMSNIVALSYTRAPLLVISNLMPAFTVNIFFTITGMLTSYQILKMDKAEALFKKPALWIQLVLFRYIRIMPIYAVVVYFTKNASKYIGDGPLWDYATSSLSQRRVCEQESWWWTLMFGANFKSPLEHCVPSAWYLANDFQFTLITPILVYIIHRFKTGRAILYMGIALASTSSFLSIFWTPLADFTSIASFEPNAFKTYVTFLAENYTRPYNRIQTYLLGVLIGQTLYHYESRKAKYLAATAVNTSQSKSGDETEDDKPIDQIDPRDNLVEEPRLSESLIRSAPKLAISALVIGALMPSIASRLPYHLAGPMLPRFMVSLMMPLYHMLFSTGVGLYLLISIAGHGNKTVNTFLGSRFWRPLSRLSLIVMLINIEVIAYIFQSSRKTVHVNGMIHLQLVGISILFSYIVAIPVYLLFESPLKQVIGHLMKAGAAKMAAKKKVE